MYSILVLWLGSETYIFCVFYNMLFLCNLSSFVHYCSHIVLIAEIAETPEDILQFLSLETMLSFSSPHTGRNVHMSKKERGLGRFVFKT